MSNRGIILLNLGSPDSPSVPDVKNYLREFLMDGRVLDAPAPIRWLIVNGLILRTRPKASAAAYRSIWQEAGSPLIITSQAQREALAGKVPHPVALGMRYGNPSTASAVEELLRAGVDDLFIVPLYPHYAMSSYETAVVHLMEILRKRAPKVKTTLLPPFYNDPDYLTILAESIRPHLTGAPFDHILFSFHGVPERHMRKGDPSHAHCLRTPDCCHTCHPAHATCYRHQCAMTVDAVVRLLDLAPEQYSMTFQSRLGREPWLQPYTDETLTQLPGKGIKHLKVVCPAFTTDCLETLEEIADEGRETFLEAGGETFAHIPCLNDSPAFIDFLEKKVSAWINGTYTTQAQILQKAPA